MNAIKMLKKKEELEKAIEQNCAKFDAIEEEMFVDDCPADKYAKLDEARTKLLEEGVELNEELEKLNEIISSIIVASPEEPNGTTIAECHYDSKIGCYKPSLGTVFIKDDDGNLIEVKLRPDNLIRSQWADTFIEGHKYRWKGRPVKKRPFNGGFEWACFVTHIEEVIE